MAEKRGNIRERLPYRAHCVGGYSAASNDVRNHYPANA